MLIESEFMQNYISNDLGKSLNKIIMYLDIINKLILNITSSINNNNICFK